MRQQLVDATGGVRRQAIQHVLEVGVGVVPVDAGRVQQAHDGRRPFACSQAASEEPIRSSDRDRADLVLDPIVGDRHVTEWLTWTRGVSLDPVLVKQNYAKALCRMRQAPANKLNEASSDRNLLPATRHAQRPFVRARATKKRDPA